MSLINWFNNFVFIENLLGIYRNFSSQKKIYKYFIVFQIFVQIFLHTIFLIGDEYFLFGGTELNQVLFINGSFSALTYANSLTFVVTGIWYSDAFMSYYRSISRVFIWFKDEKKLINSMKKTFWFSTALILFCFVCTSYRAVELFFILLHSYPYFLIPVLVSQTILRNIIIFEHLMFFVLILIVVHLLESLTLLILVVQKRVKSCDAILDDISDITREQIQDWVELYRDLANCCEKVTIFVGCQYFCSIIFTLSHYILMSYQYFYLKTFDIGNTGELKRMIISIISYISVMMMPLIAGQKARNQGVKFHRVLVRLYNTIICDVDPSKEAEAKLIKDFIRLIKKNPIEIKLLSMVPAGMYLLPVLLTLAVNYLIVMLQFNHII